MNGQEATRLIVPLLRAAALVAFVMAVAPTATYAQDGNADFLEFHFKCYSVEERTHLEDRRVTILDQFNTIETPVKKAKLLCNPAIKNPVDGLILTGPHLVCYEIEESREPFHDVDFFVGNQFGGQTLRIKETKLLCVPSCKNQGEACAFDNS